MSPTLDAAVAATRLAVRRGLPVITAGDGVWTPSARAGGAVLVACSGGADSLALLAATIFELRRSEHRVIGCVVDHGLQDGSGEHTARVVEQMAALGADETASIRVHVETAAGGVEAGARDARYAALERLAAHFGALSVLLGHTLDDQAETVLLGLARGSGGRSIAGMRPVFRGDDPDVSFHRPLLDLTRAQTEQACRAQGIEWWTDPHNCDPRFLRARVRHDVLPVLERELGPGVAETLARTAAQLRPDMEALDDLAEGAMGDYDATAGFDVVRIETLPRALRTRMLRMAAVRAGCPAGELFAVHVDALEEQVWNRTHLPRRIQLPGHVTAVREGDRLRFGATATGAAAPTETTGPPTV